MFSKYILKLYITNNTLYSHHITETLKDTLESILQENYELKIINVWETPQLAEEDKILATPTLIKVSPPPEKRIIGDMSDKNKVLLGLDLPLTPDNRRQ